MSATVHEPVALFTATGKAQVARRSVLRGGGPPQPVANVLLGTDLRNREQMDVLVLFTPEESDGRWRIRVFPWPAHSPVAGLSDDGEVAGLLAPNFGGFDERMLAVRAGYAKRLHPSGVMEVTATGRGADALREWVVDLVKAARPDTGGAGGRPPSGTGA
jgi:hypothetical protein